MYYATTKEIKQLDRLAVKAGLSVGHMMELAGARILSLFARVDIQKENRIIVVVGKGHSGGDGLCAARHLYNSGYTNIAIVLLEKTLKVDSEKQLLLLKKMDIDIFSYKDHQSIAEREIQDADVIIDAMIGFQFKSPLKKTYLLAIERIEATDALVVSYDIPSGVEATTGKVAVPCIMADYTLTLGLPKKAAKLKKSKKMFGQVFVADIGIPDYLYEQIKKRSRPVFSLDGLVELE